MDPVTIIVDRPQRRDHAVKVLSRLPVEDGEVWDVLIRRHVSKRSLSQNARLWLLHTAAAKHIGCSPEDIHEEMLCRSFGFTEVRMPTGVTRRIPLRRSSDLNKQEFREFMDQVEEFYISELGVFLEG